MHLSQNLPPIAFLIISTMEGYSYDMFLECNLHFVMGNRIFCWSAVQFLDMCVGGKQIISSWKYSF